MKRVAILVCVAALARAATTPLPQEQIDALTAIDTVPTQTQLNNAFKTTDPNQTRDKLIAIAQDQDPDADQGIRLRAIQALAKYCSPTACVKDDPAHKALTDLIAANASAHSGTAALMLRAAIESVGPLRITDDLTPLALALTNGPRDVRAAAAHALRDLCNSNAITPLHAAYQRETVDEVRLAISEALRVLPCPVN